MEIRVTYIPVQDMFQLYGKHPHITDEILVKTLTPADLAKLVHDSQMALNYRDRLVPRAR